MSFLDQLEEQARKQRQKEEAQALAREEREVFFREVAEPTIRQLFEYLKKLVDHINYLDQRHEILYTAPGYGKVTGHLRDLRVRYSASDEHRQIDIVGVAEIPPQREVEMAGDVEVKRMKSFLRERGLHGGERLRRTDKGGIVAGTFRISGEVQLRVLIHASIDDPEVRMEFTNLHDFGQLVRVVPPEHMDDDLMDKVGRFIARVDDELLKEDISEEIRAKLRETLQANRRIAVEEFHAAEAQHDEQEAEESAGQRRQEQVEHAEDLAGRFRDRLEAARRKFSGD